MLYVNLQDITADVRMRQPELSMDSGYVMEALRKCPGPHIAAELSRSLFMIFGNKNQALGLARGHKSTLRPSPSGSVQVAPPIAAPGRLGIGSR
jgi:hypothetical protein